MTWDDAKREYWAARAEYDIAVAGLRSARSFLDAGHAEERVRGAARRIAWVEIEMQTAAEARGMSRLP